MGNVVANFSMSLDGFIAGANDDDGGLHKWVFGGTVALTVGNTTFHVTSDKSAEVFREFVQNAGAVILGKRVFQIIGANPPFQLPSFVLSHNAQEQRIKDGVTITFVSDGIESALSQARVVAGDKNVYVFGGAQTVQQYLRAGLLDEIHIDLVPMLLSHGKRLFEHLDMSPIELQSLGMIETPDVTHLRFRVIK